MVGECNFDAEILSANVYQNSLIGTLQQPSGIFAYQVNCITLNENMDDYSALSNHKQEVNTSLLKVTTTLTKFIADVTHMQNVTLKGIHDKIRRSFAEQPATLIFWKRLMALGDSKKGTILSLATFHKYFKMMHKSLTMVRMKFKQMINLIVTNLNLIIIALSTSAILVDSSSALSTTGKIKTFIQSVIQLGGHLVLVCNGTLDLLTYINVCIETSQQTSIQKPSEMTNWFLSPSFQPVVLSNGMAAIALDLSTLFTVHLRHFPSTLCHLKGDRLLCTFRRDLVFHVITCNDSILYIHTLSQQWSTFTLELSSCIINAAYLDKLVVLEEVGAVSVDLDTRLYSVIGLDLDIAAGVGMKGNIGTSLLATFSQRELKIFA